MLYAQGQAPAAATGGPQAPERLAADTPKTTVMGNTFIAPKDWTLTVKGPATILEAPEGGSWIALVDVAAKDDDEALATTGIKRPTICWRQMQKAISLKSLRSGSF